MLHTAFQIRKRHGLTTMYPVERRLLSLIHLEIVPAGIPQSQGKHRGPC